jgi:hypothetical protein
VALFTRSTTDSLAATRQSLAGAEAKIAELEAARGAKLLEAETIADVQRLDSELTTQRHAANIYRDRISGLVARQRQEERERLEAEKAARIADMTKRLANWQNAAQRVDEATAALQGAVLNLDAADVAIFGENPFRQNYLSARSISALCDREAGPRDEPGINESRRVVGPLRKIAKGAPYGMAEEIADRGRRLFDGTNMIPTVFNEVSQATSDATKSPAAVGASQVFDIFCWLDSSTNRCTRGPAWSNSTTRGYTLTMVNGILLNTSSITNGPAASRGTWVGTIASNASSTIDYILGGAASGGTAAVLNVWNAYNRVVVGTTVTDSGTLYNYTGSQIRQARSSAGMQVTFVTGAAEDAWTAHAAAEAAALPNGAASYGIGLDSNVTYTSPRGVVSNSSPSTIVGASAPFYSTTSIGQHVVSLNQASDSVHTNTFDNISTDTLSFQLRM